MNYKRWTQIFVVATIIVVAAWDLFVVVSAEEASISHTLYFWSMQYPVLPFTAGVICGHLFWRMPVKGS